MRSVVCLCLSAIAVCGVAAQQITPSAQAAIAAHEPAKNTITRLPPDVAPNPPKPEDLVAAKHTWYGEYEADTLGLPLLGPDGRPLPVLYDKKGKRIKSSVKIPKTHPIKIVAGTLTVDGWTGKAQLNYDIPDLRYIYISSPSIGTVVVAQTAFLGSTEQKNAFDGKVLTLAVNGHQIQITSDEPMLGKKPASAWTKVDPTYTADRRYPVVGYGSSTKAPYEWPGARRVITAGSMDAPPLPASLRPRIAAECGGKPCPATKR